MVESSKSLIAIIAQHQKVRTQNIEIQEIKRTRKKNWPAERTSFAGVIEYAVKSDTHEEPKTVYIDFGFQKKYGRRRREITVYRKRSEPILTLLGTDSWSQTRRVLWKARHNEGRDLVRDLKNLPPEYADFEAVRYRQHIDGSGAPHCWGIALEEKAEDLIQVSLTREAVS